MLVSKYKCHTVLLYGSHARGDATPMSDYDVMGVVGSGRQKRIAKKENGKYLDVFIFPASDLKKVNENHLYMADARILFQRTNWGTKFLAKLRSVQKQPHKALSEDEIQARRVWAHKMFDRIQVNDLEAKYRKVWLCTALLSDYFEIRKQRYLGSKASFAWLKKHDPVTHRLFEGVLTHLNDKKSLKKLVVRVTRLNI